MCGISPSFLEGLRFCMEQRGESGVSFIIFIEKACTHSFFISVCGNFWSSSLLVPTSLSLKVLPFFLPITHILVLGRNL